MSNRKPFNVNAGYVASKINPITGIANVIYIASEAGIDAAHKYVTVCEAHHTMVSSTSVPKARIDMKDASQWCEVCQMASGKLSEPAVEVSEQEAVQEQDEIILPPGLNVHNEAWVDAVLAEMEQEAPASTHCDHCGTETRTKTCYGCGGPTCVYCSFMGVGAKIGKWFCASCWYNGYPEKQEAPEPVQQQEELQFAEQVEPAPTGIDQLAADAELLREYAQQRADAQGTAMCALAVIGETGAQIRVMPLSEAQAMDAAWMHLYTVHPQGAAPVEVQEQLHHTQKDTQNKKDAQAIVPCPICRLKFRTETLMQCETCSRYVCNDCIVEVNGEHTWECLQHAHVTLYTVVRDRLALPIRFLKPGAVSPEWYSPRKFNSVGEARRDFERWYGEPECYVPVESLQGAYDERYAAFLASVRQLAQQ